MLSVTAALTNGPAIAISALWRFGDKNLKVNWHCLAPYVSRDHALVPMPHLQDKYLKDVLMGRSFCALAISEPGAGSDVAGQREGLYYGC